MRQPFHTILRAAAALLLSACAAGAASIDNLSYRVGAMQISVPHVETSGGALTDGDLKAITDPNGPDSLAQRLGRLNAATVTIPEVSFGFDNAAPGAGITYHDIKLTGAAGGRIETVTVARADATFPAKAGSMAKVTYGTMTMRNFDLGLLLRIMATKRSDPNEPMAPLYDLFTVDSLKMSAPDGEMTTGRLTGSGVRGRPMAVPLTDLVQLTQDLGLNGKKPTPEQSGRIMSIVGDIFQSLEMGQVELRDMRMHITGDKPGDFSIGRMAMGQFRNGKLGEIAYEDFRLAMPDGSMHLGRLALRDFDLSRTFQTMADAASHGDPELKDANPRDVIPALGAFELSGIDFDVPSSDGHGNVADGKRIRMSLGALEIAPHNYMDGIPSALTVAVRNLVFPLPDKTDDPQLRDMVAFGIDRIDFSHTLDIAWNASANQIEIRDDTTSLPGLGVLKLTGVIGNASKDIFARDLAVVQAAALGMLIKSVDIKFDNLGVVEKAIAQQAKSSRQSIEQVRQTIVATAAVGIPAALGNGAAAKTIGDAVAKFIADPHSLHVQVQAKDGLGVSDLALVETPAKLLEKVTVTATANQ